MPRSSLRTLASVSVAFLIAAACVSCSELFDSDKIVDEPEQGGGEADAEPGGPPADAGDGDGGDDGGDDGDDDGGDSMPDAGEADAAPLCAPEGQSCNEEDPFFECNAEGECAECGREANQPCCLTAPRCEGLLGLVCMNNLCL